MKNELFNKFEEHINFIKKDNARVIKCFSGYKTQFYEMKQKFIDLSNFIRDVRFKKNIGESLNRRYFYNASKKMSQFKNQRWSVVYNRNIKEMKMKKMIIK